MDNLGSEPSGRSSRGGGGRGAVAFLYLGFMGVLGFSGVHLLFCLLTAWVLGQSFSTVVYVTAATVVTGTLVTFTFAFLVALNLVMTAFSSFSQMGQGLFGGGGGGGGLGGPPPPGSHPSASADSSSQDYDESSNLKLD